MGSILKLIIQKSNITFSEIVKFQDFQEIKKKTENKFVSVFFNLYVVICDLERTQHLIAQFLLGWLFVWV